jgi:hypothetical protein
MREGAEVAIIAVLAGGATGVGTKSSISKNNVISLIFVPCFSAETLVFFTVDVQYAHSKFIVPVL